MHSSIKTNIQYLGEKSRFLYELCVGHVPASHAHKRSIAFKNVQRQHFKSKSLDLGFKLTAIIRTFRIYHLWPHLMPFSQKELSDYYRLTFSFLPTITNKYNHSFWYNCPRGWPLQDHHGNLISVFRREERAKM